MVVVCSKRVSVLFALLFFFLASFLNAEEGRFSISDSIAFLTEGVEVFPRRGAPGPIATLGENAFPVVLGEFEEGVLEPVVAAAWVGKGRIVALGHSDYCRADSISATASAAKFFDNILFWTSGVSQKGKTTGKSIRVAVWQDEKTADFLKKQGFDARSVSSIESEDFEVFVAESAALNDSEYASLLEAVQNGAGFVTCGLGWGWSQLNPGKTLVHDHPGNRNFAKYGIPLAWTEGTLRTTSNTGYAVTADLEKISRFVDGGTSVRFLADVDSGKASVSDLAREDARQLASTLSLIYCYLSKEQQVYYDSIVDKFSEDIVPTTKNPIQEDDLITRLVISVQTDRYLRNQEFGEFQIENVPSFAAANDFPGPVPEQAERLDRVGVMVRTDVPGWASTGLYAAPGEAITVKVDSPLFSSFPKPFKVRIGVHSDRLWHLKNWTRYPEITLEKTMRSPETKVVNPFGGLVYIVVPQGIASAGLGSVKFDISGAVAAPFFVKGETSLRDWKTVRNNPAPWAELQGNEVIVTVPSSVIRSLDNPQELLETWDEILRLEAEFASGPYYRERPERITCDRQISAGYMHSGYPVMTHMDVEGVLVDNNRLRTRGDWGFFHEFGHNHQSEHWTFEGAGEVTVNYFTLYVMEKLCGLSPEQAHRELTRDVRKAKLKQYLADGANFNDWKNDPFLALNMTVQLRNEFGWEPILRTVSEYRKAPRNELPRNDDEKRDQWMVRLSHNTGRNLGPFFEKWGVPTSENARNLINNLPVWLPDEFEDLK